MSPLMRDRATTRHLAMAEISLDALKKAAKTADGTVNDAYLAVVTGGLRRYHERHGTTVRYLRAVIPISLRTAQDTGWGNRITLMRLTVPAGEPDPATRMRLLHQLTRAAREEPSLSVTGAVAGVLNMLPVGYVAGILKHADFVASNVPGIPRPVYVAAARSPGCSCSGPPSGPPSTPPCCPAPALAISASTSIPPRYQTRTSWSPVSRKAQPRSQPSAASARPGTVWAARRTTQYHVTE